MTCECYPPLRAMASAPKDGTPILASFPAGIDPLRSDFGRNDVRVIRWSGWGGGVWDSDSGHHISGEPIGWRSLPPAETGYWMMAKDGSKTWVKTE